MKKEEHRVIARELARLLGLSEYEVFAVCGADSPDLDLWFGQHRKTLHNLYPAFLATVIPNDKARTAYLVGLFSHLLTDRFSKQIKGAEAILGLISMLGNGRVVKRNEW